jgi:sulfhydrogenase subunit beta (sulfur reductase)
VSDIGSSSDTSGNEVAATLAVGSTVVLDVDDFAMLIASLSEIGYDVKGPVVRSGAIVPGALRGVDDLPKGIHDEQAPGAYRLVHGEDERLFDWAVGPSGWKAEFFPPRDEVWRARRGGGTVQLVEIRDTRRPLAVIGARPCEVAALQVLDRVFVEGAHQDTHYADRRENAFIAVVECSSPAATCFCDSMKAGPNIEAGFDLALTELDDDDGHRFVARVGSPRALAALNGVASTPVTPHDISARTTQLDGARSRMVRHLDVDGVAGLLARNLEHPRWAEVAERCLSCGNCTLVCPTCFCSDVRDVTDLDGAIGAPAHVVILLQRRSLVPPRGSGASDDPVALSPVDDPQALVVVGSVRHDRMRGLRPLRRLVPGGHRYHRRGVCDRAIRRGHGAGAVPA